MRRSRLLAAGSTVLVALAVTGVGPCDSSGISGSPSDVAFKAAKEQKTITLSNAGKATETIAAKSPVVNSPSVYKTFLLCENKVLPCTETVECLVSGKANGEFIATTVAGNVWKAVLKCP